MGYKELTGIGYRFHKPKACYHVLAPNGDKLGIYSEKREALQSAVKHYHQEKINEKR